jgi:hypothetical protein
VPSPDRGLLARMDALVTLVADRHGLALLPDGRLAAAEARVAARAAAPPGWPEPGDWEGRDRQQTLVWQRRLHIGTSFDDAERCRSILTSPAGAPSVPIAKRSYQ